MVCARMQGICLRLALDTGSHGKCQSATHVSLAKGGYCHARPSVQGFSVLHLHKPSCFVFSSCTTISCFCLCRIHLSYLGYPIANDSQYGGTFRGPDQVRTHSAAARQGQLSHLEQSNSAESDDAAVQTLHAPVSDRPHQISNKRQKYNSGAASTHSASGGASLDTGYHGACDQPEPADAVNSKTEPTEDVVEGDGTCLGEAAARKATDLLVPADLQDDLCMNCPKLIPPGYPTEIHPLWLHAQEYTSEAWSFVCTKPQWADADWKPPL